jgi:hypothetical protein
VRRHHPPAERPAVFRRFEAAGGGAPRCTSLVGDLVEQVRPGIRAARAIRKEAENLERLADGAVHGSRGGPRARRARPTVAESTIVIALADHGENLMDGGGPLAHGEAVERDDSNAIPLSFRWPGRIAPRRIDTPVSLMDVAPTLAHALGASDHPSDGISLWPALSTGEPLPSDRGFLFETCIWFFAKEQAAHGDPSGRALSYPDFTRGLLEIEPGPAHIAAPAGDAVLKAAPPSMRALVVDYFRATTTALRSFDRATASHDLTAQSPTSAAMTRVLRRVRRVGTERRPPEPPAAPARRWFPPRSASNRRGARPSRGDLHAPGGWDDDPARVAGREPAAQRPRRWAGQRQLPAGS